MATSGWRRQIAACTKKVIRPPAARHAARKSIGAIVLPVASRIHGTTFCAMKPPRLPTELIAASPAAAEAPVRNFDGRLHLQRDGSRYAYRLTTKGVEVALLFLFFHKALCGPLANSRFHHQPKAQHRPNSRLETAYHHADKAIQTVVDLLVAA